MLNVVYKSVWIHVDEHLLLIEVQLTGVAHHKMLIKLSDHWTGVWWNGLNNEATLRHAASPLQTMPQMWWFLEGAGWLRTEFSFPCLNQFSISSRIWQNIQLASQPQATASPGLPHSLPTSQNHVRPATQTAEAAVGWGYQVIIPQAVTNLLKGISPAWPSRVRRHRLQSPCSLASGEEFSSQRSPSSYWTRWQTACEWAICWC